MAREFTDDLAERDLDLEEARQRVERRQRQHEREQECERDLATDEQPPGETAMRSDGDAEEAEADRRDQ